MQSETVIKKLDLLDRCMPVKTVVEYGGMWGVDNLYATECVKRWGVKKVLSIDFYESDNWKVQKRHYPQITFIKGDFRNKDFMKKITKKYDLGICYDILLHQPECYETLELMLSKIKTYFCFAQPVIEEKRVSFKNTMVFLPGSQEKFQLRPYLLNKDIKIFDINRVDPSHWIWAMTPTLIKNMLKSLRWKIIYEDAWQGWLPKISIWKMYRCIAKKEK